MIDKFSRTSMLIGYEALLKLKNSHVAVFGVGGVGGFVCEALARAGVGNLDLIDNLNNGRIGLYTDEFIPNLGLN